MPGPDAVRPWVAPLVTAHQGGWDELALVGVPLAVLALLLWLAARRAAREVAEEDDATEGGGPPEPDGA